MTKMNIKYCFIKITCSNNRTIKKKLQQQQKQQHPKTKTYRLYYSDSDTGNDCVPVKRKPKQRQDKYAYHSYSKIEDHEEEKPRAIKQQKKKRKTNKTRKIKK